MKKILIVSFASLMSTFCYAQFEKGRVLISGQSAFDFSSFKSEAKQDGNSMNLGKQSSVTFSPTVGYFFADNLVIGAALDITSAKEEIDFFGDEMVTKETTVAVGPFLRYYLSKGLFSEASIAFGSSMTEVEYNGDSESEESSVFGWAVGLGYAAMISDQVAVEPSIGYASVSFKPDGTDGTLVTSGLVLGLGFSIYLQ